jgi:hypothetical protein
MSTDPSKFLHLAYPVAVEIARQIDNTVSADLLCRAGLPYPVAVDLARQISAGVGNMLALHAAHGFSPDCAKALKTAIELKGAH